MKVSRPSSSAPCPCGGGPNYAACCAVWHDGWDKGIHPPSPQVLMRSRYSAYVVGRVDYLLATWHPGSSPGELELAPVKWLGLELRDSQASADAGVVEFVARYRDNGRGVRMHEISRFVRESGRWLYVDGQQLHGDQPEQA